MDIKLTNTGVIPLDDFREGQNFLVWFDIHCSGAVLLYKAGDEFLCSGNLRSVPKTQEFLAWEPVEIQHSFSPYVTRSLSTFGLREARGFLVSAATFTSRQSTTCQTMKGCTRSSI